ncbi:hypothetical protein HII31_06018 [Pseudocercospora fuligena]|uniref:Uncharacterized protein n=1 Tax=Pseudocercospora fuligena TaxID=685502 RepID=A0A8H6VLN5_9PEZI|nr:hypothetical protein HII31_06018 [Pseudocercospora fuligena]
MALEKARAVGATSQQTQTAAQKVFAIYELLEKILVAVADTATEKPDTTHDEPMPFAKHLFPLRRVNSAFAAVLADSSALHDRMYLNKPGKTLPKPKQKSFNALTYREESPVEWLLWTDLPLTQIFSDPFLRATNKIMIRRTYLGVENKAMWTPELAQTARPHAFASKGASWRNIKIATSESFTVGVWITGQETNESSFFYAAKWRFGAGREKTLGMFWDQLRAFLSWTRTQHIIAAEKQSRLGRRPLQMN